jgi:YD repeat-containing protein
LTWPWRGNGLTTLYAYDSAGRLAQLCHQPGPDATCTAPLEQIAYQHDATGNITRRSDNDGIHTYTYDALNRLTEAAYPSSVVPAAGWPGQRANGETLASTP